MSISGSLDLAIDRAVAIGCCCLQIFYGSPRQWRTMAYPEDVLARFVEKRRHAGLDPLVAHGCYLVNLATSSRELQRKSTASLLTSARGVERLGGLGVITHLGSRGGAPRSLGLRRAAAAVRRVLDRTESAVVILENSAGGGSTLGASFEDIADVVEHLGGHPRVGVCLDTAHLFAAGWDLRMPEGVRAMVQAADRTVGWKRVRLLHLNDSRGACGSHVDRHENIGAGLIGAGGFRAILAHPRIRSLPGIIETPGFDDQGPDRKNLARLARLQDGARRAARKGVMHERRPGR